jgi:isopentenyl phosphate kinase
VSGDGKPVLLVKLGGSLITDKRTPETARPVVIARLARELAEGWPAARERGLTVVVGHGSGSFGHVAAAEHGVAGGLTGEKDQLKGVAATQAKAAELHAMVLAALRAAGLPAWSFVPSSALVTEGGRPMELHAEPLARALAAGLLPVTYGDVVVDRAQGVAIASTETVFRALTAALPEHGWRVREALWLGETPGVFGDDGEVIAEIRPGDTLAAGPAAGTDVTGGMAHRVEATVALAGLGVTSWIANGRENGLLARSLAGERIAATRVEAS